MKKRLLALILVFCLLIPAMVSAASLTETSAYKAMIAMKSKYPEGKKWTNSNYYAWKGGYYSGGYGCAGFAFILSDAAFGSRKARIVSLKDYNGLQVGDILRINNDSHSVIILKIDEKEITIAEGNYGGTIHWGRTLTKSQVKQITDYVMTRYPQVKSLDVPTGLTAEKEDGKSPVISWDKTDKATFYDIYRNNKKIATVTKTKFTDETAVDGENYQYCVVAKAKSDAKVISSKKSAKAFLLPLVKYQDQTGFYELCDGKATFMKAADPTAETLVIPGHVTGEDGVKYKVTAVANNACKGMTNLKSLTIGKNVKTIGKYAFANCSKLKDIIVKTSGLTEKGIGTGCFKNIQNKAKVKVPGKKLSQYSKWLVKTGKMPSKAVFSK